MTDNPRGEGGVTAIRYDFSNNRNMCGVSCGQILLEPMVAAQVTSAYVDWLNDAEVNAYLEVRHHRQTIDGAMAYVAARIAEPHTCLFAAHENGRFIGTVKLDSFRPYHGTAMVAFMLGEKSVWGRGLGSQMVMAACHFGFQRIGLRKINAGCYGRNIASHKLLAKCEFSLEGCQTDQVMTKDGPDDVLIFGLLASAYPHASFPSAFADAN